MKIHNIKKKSTIQDNYIHSLHTHTMTANFFFINKMELHSNMTISHPANS
jgi:hypothetical protein